MDKDDVPATAPPVNQAVRAAATASEQKKRRDDFKAATKRLLALRVGYLCSKPDCQKPTIGPKKGGTGYVSTGVAAHIKAAAPEGPRYDQNQTVAERGAFDNGLWLCADHAHIIDHDEKHFTTELLLEWKRGAEERAFRQLVSGQGHAAILNTRDDLVAELRNLRSQLGLPEEQDLDWVRERVAAGALAQIEAFEAAPTWPPHPVNLELASNTTDRLEAMDISRLPKVVLAVQKVVLISGPGTGKTTTLLQAARFMMTENLVPLFVPLGEWAESSSDLLGWLIGRHGYEGLNVNHLKILAHHGELVLFLDGWNEVPASSRRRLIKELDGLQRDFSLLNIVMSSRREALEMSLKGRRLDVLSLSESQQTDIARGLKGDAGVRVLDAAWRTDGLRELVSIPLYLRSLLAISDAGKLPETKEEVLRRMVDAHEAEPANADLFNRELLGFQRRYLSALATSAQREERTTLPAKDARSVVAAVNRSLIEEGETSASPSAQDVLNKLVDAHSLVQNEESFGFQHQQILEWFASLDLEIILRASKDDLALDNPVVTECLNEAAWSEPILFASERMSRSDAVGIGAIAAVVEILLKIDPLFAAAVVRRSGPAVWEVVSKTVSSFARAWHASGKVDRAIAFMIETGQAEFADILWPLVASQDPQVQSHTIQLVRRFNPSVLGDLLKREYSSLPDQTRDSLVGELAYHGDSAGMDAALELALLERSPAIRFQAFAGLSFRGATTRIEELLRKSADELAEIIAERGYLDAIHDKSLLADLERRKEKLAPRRPEGRLAEASRSTPDVVLRGVIISALRDREFSFRDQGAYALAEAARRLPETVAATLRWRLENGLDLPFRPFGYLEAEAPTDTGPLPGMLLNEEVARDVAEYASFLVGAETVKRLLESLLVARREFRVAGLRTQAAYAPVRKLYDILESTRASVLFEALQSCSTGCTPVEIEDFCEVITSHGRHHDGEDLPLTAEQRESAVALLNGWGRQLLIQGANRRELGALARTMRRLAHPSQVNILADMLNADLVGLSTARAASQKNRRDEAALDEIRSSHSHDYRLSLTAVGTQEAEAVLAAHLHDPEFGIEAAVGLQVIWLERNEPRVKKAFQPWPDFERAMINRSRDRGTTTESAEAILQAAELAKADGTQEGHRRAMKFAGCAALLPHGQRADFYAELISADVDPRAKLDLATRMLVGGLIVPTAVIEDALKQAVDALGERKWVSDDQFEHIIGWIKLLPFSDRPDDTLHVLDSIAVNIKLPWLRIRDILSMVRHISESQRIGLLRGFVQRFPELAAQYDLYIAMQNPGGLTLDFLQELASGRYGKGAMDRGTPYDYPQTIYAALPAEERDGLLDRFTAARDQTAREFIAAVLVAGSDHEAFLKLVCDVVGRRAIAHNDWSTRQHLLYHHQPIGGNTNQFDLIPRDLRRLRKGLFDLIKSDDAEARAFASEYLNSIDQARDKEGGIDAGPRHPNIASGWAWPEILSIGSAG
ncbi:NACHT domain-containing protein [Rhizobium leguminosarum]|uniref:NACHT domain-containing protein n=1 Tax=Rhizobium leguminosarum TaxID=384 RepID=UPI003F9E1680